MQIRISYLSYTGDIINKQIIHFGKDPHKEEFYNLIVKVTDISSKDVFKDVWNELKHHGFIIHHNDEHTIEALFKNRYLEVLNKFRELEKIGWKVGEL